MFSMFSEKQPGVDKLVSSVINLKNTSNWQASFDTLIKTHNLTENNSLARKLLEKSELKLAVYLIDELIKQKNNRENIKKGIFNQLKNIEDIQYYYRYLSFLWTEHTEDILKRVHSLCNKLNTRDSSVFSKKLQDKFGVDNYLQRSEKSLVKINALVQEFFLKIDSKYQSIGQEIRQQLQCLHKFYSLITVKDANLLFNYQLKILRKNNAKQKLMDRQHELIQAAINGQISFISKQSLADIYGEEANAQGKKLSILGVRLFDVNHKEDRALAARDYVNKVDEKLNFPYGHGFEY